MKLFPVTFLILVFAIAVTLVAPGLSGEVIKQSAENGNKQLYTESKSDSKGSIVVLLEFRENETLLEVILTRDGDETPYDSISVVPHNKDGKALPIRRKYMMPKTFHTEHQPIVDREIGYYLMTEKDAVRIFSVDVTRNGETTSFELHLLK